MAKLNKKTIMSALLTSSILISTYAFIRDSKERHNNDSVDDKYSIELTEEKKEDNNLYINKTGGIVLLDVLNNSEYVTLYDDYMYTLCNNANVYFKNDKYIVDEMITNSPLIVSVIEVNSDYALIILPDGRNGYVSISSLVKCANLDNYEYVTITENNQMVLNIDTKIYSNNGMYIGDIREGVMCTLISTNGEYSLITFADGNSVYVLASSLVNVAKEINGYAYLKNSTVSYSDKELESPISVIEGDQVLYIISANDTYAYVANYDGSKKFYLHIEDIDKDFIMVDLTNQRMDCYLDYHVAGSWGTRTGKNSSPTHEGSFDIDWKYKDWEFTTFPGSYARYWIPINEFEEGIHDLVNDDEWNYGNQAYQLDGSHGCIRVPVEASEFVYENYEVGDMVLVRKR